MSDSPQPPDDSILKQPLPPPIPPAAPESQNKVIGYARQAFPDEPYRRPGPTFAQQAAKASWVAPLVAAAINMCTGAGATGGTPMSRDMEIVKLVINGGLVVAGLVFGILALVKRRGADSVVVPAVTGITLNVIILMAPLLLISSLTKARVAAQAASNATAQKTFVNTARQLLVKTDASIAADNGWVGAVDVGTATVVVAEVPNNSQAYSELRSSFATDAIPVLVEVDATKSSSSVAVEISTLRLTLKDGTEVTALPPEEVCPDGITDRRGWIQLLNTSTTPNAGTTIAKLVFVPAGTKMFQVARAKIQVNGNEVYVPGSYLLDAEKTARMQRVKAAKP